MTDAILVLNAGSSSIKFSLFVARGDDLALDLRGQIEGLYTAAHFIAKDATGRLLSERSWEEGTRSGSLDPSVILYLLDERGMDAHAIEKLIYNQSGLLGVSGISSDMRTLLASEDPRAKLAIDIYRIRRELGSLAEALGGLDAIVFTAGIGENTAVIRSRVCRDAAWLGVDLDADANAAGGPRISTGHSSVAVWVIPTNEELMIARHTLRVIAKH
jgi:acetate kinase